MTSLPGPAFYDDEEVFATYWASRERPDNPNDTLEQPILRELIGELHNRRILDLGYGAAAFGRYALAHGARSYLGIEGSRNMAVAAGRTLAGTAGQVAHAAIETWLYPKATFDLVVSSLALHYVSELDAVFAGVHRALVDGGRFIFSVEHTIITSCARGWQTPQRQDWIVDDYFVVGPRETAWLGGEVIRYHRTVEGYVAALQQAGFVLDRLRESHPRREWFVDEAEYERRTRIPLFLFLAGQKPETSPGVRNWRDPVSEGGSAW
jgi:SAM-dependent methyltransferase